MCVIIRIHNKEWRSEDVEVIESVLDLLLDMGIAGVVDSLGLEEDDLSCEEESSEE